MPRISKKCQLENEIATTIEVVTLAMLLTKTPSQRKWKKTITIYKAQWASHTMQYLTHNTSSEALRAQQFGCQLRMVLSGVGRIIVVVYIQVAVAMRIVAAIRKVRSIIQRFC